MASLFEADIASLKGVGPKRAELFRKLGAPTVGDLLRLYPRAYEDWRDAVPIRNTLLNEVNIVKGTVLRRPVEQRIRGGMTLYKTTITDGEDDMQLTFFNNRYITSLLTEGAVYAFRGKVTGTFMRREMASPEFVPESRMQDMVPVYPQTSGLTSRIIANAVKEALRLLPETVKDPLPDALRLKYALCRLEYALKTDGELSRQDVEHVLACGRDTALKVLNGLVERGIMAKDGKARATRYHIIEAKGA